MKIEPTTIAGLNVVETEPYIDTRGLFSRLYCEQQLSSLMGARRILQVNFSLTAAAGVVRGLHFQRPPYAEMKLVRCMRGEVWDVAVDLRFGSPTFLKWHAEILSSLNRKMIVIPEGFAHGFQVIEPGSELLYLHTANYNKIAEGALRYDDPLLSIRWPLTVTDLSERDAAHPLIGSDFLGFHV
jgi:dTDP-4-dehydrorhamnose 3,5-epimerase